MVISYFTGDFDPISGPYIHISFGQVPLLGFPKICTKAIRWRDNRCDNLSDLLKEKG